MKFQKRDTKNDKANGQGMREAIRDQEIWGDEISLYPEWGGRHMALCICQNVSHPNGVNFIVCNHQKSRRVIINTRTDCQL